MKKVTLLILISICSLYSSFAQTAVLINGGQFGNPNENVNVVLIDLPTLTYDTLDTIQTGSVQNILIENEQFFVLAQDSIVKYDANSGQRLAAAAFPGPSTRTLAMANGELLVGNWFGKSSDNLYIYDAEDLQLLDSVTAVEDGVRSILIDSGYAYISQNASSPSFRDTMGMIIKVDIANREVVDTISLAAYSFDFGELVKRPDGSGFYSINSFSNTITSIDFDSLTATNTSFNQNFSLNTASHLSRYEDTLFLRMNGGIGAINLNDLSIIDSLIIDTAVTAFSYDTLNKQFLVTQTDFFSYSGGKIYSRSGVQLDTLFTGFSPEAIGIIPDQTVGLTELANKENEMKISLYPNPSKGLINIQLQEEFEGNEQFRLFNMTGQLIREDFLIGQRLELDLSALDKGFYLITITSGERSWAEKIILH